jgi:hypothetical protein
MSNNWSSWRRFPDPNFSGSIEAPMGPGVYEVRRISTGEVVAFGAAPVVARSLAALRLHPCVKSWISLSRQQPSAEEFEYRTCTAATPSAATLVAENLRGRRRTYLKRRVSLKGGLTAPSLPI